ncbi:MAG TPA: phosphoribosylformylglycinamidine synthase subunit PurL, partial [Candidatus Limnocylindria bacterium]|nr:phosphoribosylformylglycinamidine synthase subunit PurL [Candidatus Limnocylindria bacterium]
GRRGGGRHHPGARHGPATGRDRRLTLTVTARSADLPADLHGLTPDEYHQVVRVLGREPNAVELGMFGAMWSEHCAYKNSRPLLRTLPTSGQRVLVGPGENAGALDIGDGMAVVFKVESHNHPSAVEPYQGAATGVGGIIRDIFTMGARPLALLNGLRFGPLSVDDRTDAATVTRNRYLFGGVVAGIAGYGNCIGIPDVGGELYFDPSYSGNPLVNAMCVGLARHEEITLARAAGAGNVLLLVGATTGRDGIQGASFASATLGEDREERRPAVQVGNPFLEKLLMEACLELSQLDAVVAMQDLGAAGLTCALSELSARGGCGAEVNLDAVPRREHGMTPYEVLLSESQERMLIVVQAGREAEVQRVFERYELHAADIGRVIDEPVVRCSSRGEVVCELPGRALADEAPTYVRDGRPPLDLAERHAEDLVPLAAQPPSVADLLALLASPNLCDRKPVWLRYDHMNGTNTLVGPGEGDAALLRVKGTQRALAFALDGPGRVAGLDPRLAAAAAVLEGAMNVAVSGARPIGLTNCLNFASPETPEGYWQLSEAVAGLAEAARALDIPIVSGNVSLYNETPEGPILPAPLVGMVGLLENRSLAVPMRWRDGDELWLLGDAGADPASLAGSEVAVARGVTGGRPALSLEGAVAIVALLPRLVEAGVLSAAHDISRGGLGVALARMAIESRIGASVELPAGPPTAVLFGERAGRAILGVPASRVAELRSLVGDAPLTRLGAAGGTALQVTGAFGELTAPVSVLRDAWQTTFVDG